MATTKEPVQSFKLPSIGSSNQLPVSAATNGNPTRDVSTSYSVQGSVAMDTEATADHHGNKGKFPTIILRDVVGRELNTETSYQRAIYEAKWRLAQGEGPTVPEEWRLPHGRSPARPDFSRTAPPLALKRLYKLEMKKQQQQNRMYHSHPELPEALEADKGYTALRWSLQQAETLPPLAAATLLRESERGSARTYMPFVGVAPIVNRPTEELDKREAEYVFPGFCYGCSRGTGLCYGCERDSQPHFHYDKPFRTGGGFSYFKRDKPIGEIPSNNPANWRVSLPAPRGLPPTSYVFYDDLSGAAHPDFKKYGVQVRVRPIPEVGEYPEDTYVEEGAETTGIAGRSRGSRREVTFASTMESGLAIAYPYTLDSDEDAMYGGDMGRLPSGSTYDQLLPTLREHSMVSDAEAEEGGEGEGADRSRTEFTSGTTGTTLTTEGSGASSKKSRGLYKPPKAFKLKAQEKKTTLSEDPFSKDRVYDIPTGSGIDIKKSDKKLTDFDEFRFGEGNWEEPKQFEFKDRPESVPDQRVRAPPVELPKKSKTDLEPKPAKPPSPKKEEKLPKLAKAKTPPKATKSTGKPEKRQRVVVKKERKRREPPVRKTRRETEPTEEVVEDAEEEEDSKEKTMTPEPELEPEPEPEPEVPLIPVRERKKLPTPPPMRRVAPPPLPRAIPAVPPLPREYTDPERPTREVSQTLIEAPPPMFEPPKQRRPPPQKRPKTKPREFRAPQVRTGDTPAARIDTREVMDPLDYLAKYCIIHKDRLPLYERVFRKVVKEQNYRYVDVPHPDPNGESYEDPDAAIDGKSDGSARKRKAQVKVKLEPHEQKMINDMTVINRSTREEYSKTGVNIGDQNVSKVHFTLDVLIDKYEELQEKHDKLQGDRIMLIAEIAKVKFPDVAKLNYKPKSKGKKKGKKKKAAEPPPSELMQSATDVAVQTEGEEQSAPSPRGPKKVTDVDIVGRLNKKMLDEINGDPDILRMNMEISRLQEKLRDVDDRIEDLEDEKKVLQLYSRDEFQKDVTRESKPEGFLRQQSALYRKMHQQPDEEMNVSELGEALQQINGHLITEKELQFIYHVLDIPGRRRINLQLFSVIAALSEKVKQVDPFIRKLINKFNYEALNVKMDRSKELFWLLDEQEDGVPSGKITSSSLAVELAAGGVTPEHTQYVVNKFSRENKGVVDFMDYLTYVPLFIEIHGRIVDDPLSSNRVF